MPEPENREEGSNRRGRHRAPTARHALFSSYERGMMGQGTVVDISSDGLQIHCHVKVEPGEELDLDIYPKNRIENIDVFRGRGRVAHVRPLGRGEWAMGIQLISMLPSQTFSAIQHSMPPAKVGAPVSMVELPVVHFQSATPPDADKVDRRRMLVLLALIACFLFLLMRACAPVKSARSVHSNTLRKDQGVKVPPQVEIAHAQRMMEMGKPEEAVERFAALALDVEQPLQERFIARLGEAEALVQAGKKNTALERLSGLEGATGVAAPWRRLAGDYARQIRSGTGKAGPLSGMFVPLNFANPSGTPTETKPEFKIIVDKSDHTLELLKNNRSMAMFPVGLGAETPDGEFQIANKLTTPDWNNRGRRVKAGDPKNPLGGRWMGLKNNQGPTPYGIHPTKEEDSIGKDKSRGCIRMREQDAETLFQRCPSGTPVLIRP